MAAEGAIGGQRRGPGGLRLGIVGQAVFDPRFAELLVLEGVDLRLRVLQQQDLEDGEDARRGAVADDPDGELAARQEGQIGRAPGWTPVTNAPPGWRLRI